MLPERLKILRKKIKFKQTDIASLLKITVRNYQRYEAGEIEPNISSLIALAEYYNVPLDYLVGRDVSSDCPLPAVTPDEFALVEKLRALPPEKRRAFEALLD